MILLYFILIIGIGLYSKKKQSSNDFLYASRKLTLPSFIATIVTTWYGGILEVGRFTYENGIITWIIFCLFYYISAFLFSYFIGPKIHENNIESIPKYFNLKFNTKTSIIANILIYLLSSPAPYILILSSLISSLYNFSFILSLLISIATSSLYIYIGGFKSIIRTDKIQFIFMYSGFAIFLYFLIIKFGGISFIINNIDSEKLSLTSNLSFSYVFSWFFISFIIFIDPSIFQRVYSSKNKSIIKNGFAISILLWFIFDIITISVGLYAIILIPETELIGNPYIHLSNIILPDFWKNLFYISLFATIMSTIDSTFFISGITISEIINNSLKLNKLESVKIGLLFTSISVFILCYLFKNAISIWYVVGTITASSLLLPFIILLYNDEYKNKYPVLVVSVPIFVTIISFICLSNNIDPIYAGLASSSLMLYLFKYNY